MIHQFAQIFRDNNEYNEKTIIGFISFGMMVLTAMVDLVSVALGHPVNPKEYIYNSFLTITLGSFAVAGVERFSPSAKIEAEHTVKQEAADASLVRQERVSQMQLRAISIDDVPEEPKHCPHCGELI